MTTELQIPQKEKDFADQVRFVARLGVLAIALFLLSRNITGWFTGWREDNSASYSYFARNHVQYGLGYTKFFNTYADTEGPLGEPHRYLTHPPLISIFAAIPMSIFGDHEWVARLVPILATLASAWLLMVIISRLQSPVLGLLSGLFYVLLPISAYFGRIFNFESPTQFFSLLMLHGYLQWSGLYPGEPRRKAGLVYYVLGVVLGIGTDWSALIMAGLIWLWHLCRSIRQPQIRRDLLLLTLVPAISQTAVVVHILWGSGWNFKWFGPLLLSRTLGSKDPKPWIEWLSMNWTYLKYNFTWFGIAAVVIYLAVIPAILRFSNSASPFRRVVRDKTSLIPVLLMTLQGFIWVVAFKQQSWTHDYWQYYITPLFAVAIGSFILATYTLLSKLVPRTAILTTMLLMLVPIPFFANSLDKFHQQQNVHMQSVVSIFKKLSQIVPARAPVMMSAEYPEYSRYIGNYLNYVIDARIAYYANRKLIQSTDINEIEANQQDYAAYIMLLSNDPKSNQLAQQLKAKYKLAWSGGDCLIFLLNHTAENK